MDNELEQKRREKVEGFKINFTDLDDIPDVPDYPEDNDETEKVLDINNEVNMVQNDNDNNNK